MHEYIHTCMAMYLYIHVYKDVLVMYMQLRTLCRQNTMHISCISLSFQRIESMSYFFKGENTTQAQSTSFWNRG